MNKKSGFTLIELSVVLIIISLIIGMTVASGVSVISSTRLVATNKKLDAINQALMAFRVANDRLPCPSDLSRIQGNATYGTEGTCTAIAGGVFLAKNAVATATAAEGGIPTVALGLPNDFMYDGWGNRIRYAVDTGMTAMNAFSGSQIGCVDGAITINTGSTVAYPAAITFSTGAIYALISHGANGHGAVTTNASIYNAGSLNADELTNCHCTSTGAAGTYAPTYVQQIPYTYKAIAQANSNYNFDDIVTFKERWQMQTNWDKTGTNCFSGVYSRTVTIDHTKVGTVSNTNQTNFPVLFSGTYSYLATAANGGNVTNANGYDITFTSDAAGKIGLPFERESYNAATGAVVFWVQVPTISHSSDTVIYLQYNNPNITTDQSQKTAVWDNNYTSVWHLIENPTGSSPQMTDSTINDNSATSNGTWTSGQQVAGKIGGSLSFNGSNDYISKSNNATLQPSRDMTISLWAKLTQTASAKGEDEMFIAKTNSISPWFSYQFYTIQADNTLEVDWYNTTPTESYIFTNTALTNGVWYYITFVKSNGGATGKIYLNGTDNTNSSASVASSGTMINSDSDLTIGAFGDGTQKRVNGLIDEIRISNIARSADWIKTEYNNQNAPDKATYGASGFYTVGAQTSR